MHLEIEENQRKQTSPLISDFGIPVFRGRGR